MRLNPSIMVIGTGVIGGRVFYDLAHSKSTRRLHLFGRNLESVRGTANLARFSSLQRGMSQQIDYSVGDLNNVEQTSEVIARVNPDLIFLAVSFQSWWVISTLPDDAFEALAAAHYGPWVPMHMAPVIKAMTAVRSASSKAIVVNAAFPDAIHPALYGAGLSPDVGVGNVANNVPALRVIAAEQLNCDLLDVEVRLVAHHYVSHRMRYGDTGSARVGLQVTVKGEDVSSAVPIESLLEQLSVRYRRTAGIPGQAMVAAEAVETAIKVARKSMAMGDLKRTSAARRPRNRR